MTARQIRPAAERKARKAERKDAAAITKQAEDVIKDEAAIPQRAEDARRDEAAISQRAEDVRRSVNRANAQFSTGPHTEAGKAVSSQNALKTALTGRTVLLPTDDRAHYEQHLTHYFALWNPVGEHECTLVRLLADTWWRLLRIPYLEASIYAKGRTELIDVEPNLLESEVYLKYEKQLRNLFLQERRLSSYASRLKAELEGAQSQREAAPDDLGHQAPEPLSNEHPTVSQELGFEFSLANVQPGNLLNSAETTAAYAKTSDAAFQNHPSAQ